MNERRTFDPVTTRVTTYCTLHEAHIVDFNWQTGERWCAEYDPEGADCEVGDFYMVPAVENE